MTFYCVFCIQMACTARTVICFPRPKRPTADGGPSFPITAAGSVVLSSICSLAPSGGRPAIAVPPSFRSCAASCKAPRRSITPMNSASIAPTCSRVVTRYTRSSVRIFPPTRPLVDPVTEADELYQNAKQKGRPHLEPQDPPRRRANQTRGHGEWASDRPPIVGIVGRGSGQIRLCVCHNSDRATLEPLLVAHTRPDASVNTDEWAAYRHLAATGRTHRTVCATQRPRDWAPHRPGDASSGGHRRT